MLKHTSSTANDSLLKCFFFSKRPHSLDYHVFSLYRSLSRSLSFSYFFHSLSFTALLRDNLCMLPGSFICQYLVEARGGHQMKNINHTGELQGDLGEKRTRVLERSEKRNKSDRMEQQHAIEKTHNKQHSGLLPVP